MKAMHILLLVSLTIVTATIKAQPSVAYEKIIGLTAFASSEYTGTGRVVDNVINESGLNADGSHSNSASTMWATQDGSAANHTLILKMAAPTHVLGMHIWNGNWVGYTNRGVNSFDIYYSSSVNDLSGSTFSNGEWTLLRADNLAEASGTTSYTGEYKDMAGLPANTRWIGLDIKSNHGGSFPYTMLSEIELYKPEGISDAVATLSGDAGIVSGQSTPLTIEFIGTPPFDVVYSDGVNQHSLSVNDYYTEINVSPNTTTTYELVSVSDANGTGTVSGTATVTVYTQEELYTTIENAQYLVSHNKITNNLELTEKSSGVVLEFAPVFYVARNESRPSVSESSISEDFNYKTVSVEGNTDYFSSRTGDFSIMTPSEVTTDGSKMFFTYAANADFAFSATMELPESGDGEPKFKASLTPSSTAYFSIGYCGAPAYSINEVEEIFQPLPFTEKRFPESSYLTPAYKATLPATLATINGTTYGVIADRSEFPFNPLPNGVSRSPFGVTIRDNAGQVRPMVWALIMGNADSQISSGTEYAFNYRLYVSNRGLSSAYEDIARRLYGFSDYRHNDLGSLNSAFENLLEFAMGPYGRYLEDMKGYSYETDIPNSVKNTSALPIHSMAFVVNDSVMFKERALPITEYMLSRESFNYSKDGTSGTGQTAPNDLGDPCMNISEMMGYYITGSNYSHAFWDLAVDNAINYSNNAFEKEWRENMAMYKATGEFTYLNKVINGADKYINERINTKQTGFDYINHSKSSFWSSLAPKFWELYETYELTGYQRYLDAAQKAARSYAYHLWMSPAVPDEMITCNIGDKAPLYRSGTAISIPEEDAPAWRLSSVGLSCEAGGTSTGKHRAVFMANHAPFFMRIGALTNDQFLMDVAKAAIIGRWRSFPGYHINTDRTTVYEKVDFAHREISELLTTTSMHYSHVWPMVALTFDYLVSDAFAKSGGAIDFPTEFTENTANLYNNLYFKPGVFYGDENVTPWMPVGLVTCDNQELNYIVARGNNKLYLAFVNQSGEDVNAQININSQQLTVAGNTAQVWKDNEASGTLSVSGNAFNISVSANGITAVAINDVAVEAKFQDKMYFQSGKNDWQLSYKDLTTVDARAMMIGFSNDYTRVYAYSDATKDTYSNVRFKVWFDGVQQDDVLQTTYPYEYGEWVPRSVNTVRIEITSDRGTPEEVVFTRNPYTVAASVSGWTSVLKGDNVTVTYHTDGKPPWDLTYSDGENVIEKKVETQSYSQVLTPEHTTTFTLLSAVDADGDMAMVELDKAKVSIANEFILDYSLSGAQDAYVYLLGADNRYGTEPNLRIKGRESSQREVFVEFDVTNANLSGNVYQLGLWLTNSIATNAVIEVLGSDESWDESTITWNTKPASESFVAIDTIGISNLSPEGMYHYFNVTDFVKNNPSDKVNFKVKFLQGDEDLDLRFNSKEEGDGATAPILVSDVSFQGIPSSIEETDGSEVKVFILNHELFVQSQKEVKGISIVNMAGQIVGQKSNQACYPLTGFISGTYIAVIELESDIITKRFIVM
ncbi:DUF7594 domain-containing protein [Carboxylicivirga sp. RSCT41]|uniref:CBM96 family carbohydrate-binding protein n=1 Tax=Carboxylicivirga agarovorans TaxID=3417570 RepID=UPI003D34E2A5